MANSFIDAVTLATVIGTSYDNVTVKPLRPKYVFDSLCKEKVWNLNSKPSKGDTIAFPILAALSSNTAALDPTATLITGSQTSTYTRRTVSLSLYGDHGTLDTLQSRAETFVDEVSDFAWNLADSAMNSLDKLARAQMDLNKYRNETSGNLSGTYHCYGSYGFGASTAGPLKAKTVRAIVAKFKGQNVPPFADGYYRAVITPEQYTQVRADSDNAGWTTSIQYTENSPFIMGELPAFEGVKFISSVNNAGYGDNTVSAYFIAPEFVGKAIGKDVSVSSNPQLYGPQNNLMVIKWNALVGYKIIRREAGIICQTTSTVA